MFWWITTFFKLCSFTKMCTECRIIFKIHDGQSLVGVGGDTHKRIWGNSEMLSALKKWTLNKKKYTWTLGAYFFCCEFEQFLGWGIAWKCIPGPEKNRRYRSTSFWTILNSKCDLTTLQYGYPLGISNYPAVQKQIKALAEWTVMTKIQQKLLIEFLFLVLYRCVIGLRWIHIWRW